MTRKEYMTTAPKYGTAESTAYWHDYMRQFVSPSVTRYVLQHIPLAELAASTDQYLNDIPLHRWDALSKHVCTLTTSKRRELGECNSLSTGVSIAKAAAREALTHAAL